MGHALPDWLVMGLLQTLNRKDIKQMFCCDLKLLRWRLWVWLVYAWIVSNDPFLKPVLRAVTVQVEPNAGASARNVLDISQTAVPASPLSFFIFFFLPLIFPAWIIRGIDIMIYYSKRKNEHARAVFFPFRHRSFCFLLQTLAFWRSACLSRTFTAFTDVAL